MRLAGRPLFDEFRRLNEQRGGHGAVERFGSFEIYYEFETAQLLDRQIGRPLALQYFVNIDGGVSPSVDKARSI